MSGAVGHREGANKQRSDASGIVAGPGLPTTESQCAPTKGISL